jgi:hypothetical protein
MHLAPGPLQLESPPCLALKKRGRLVNDEIDPCALLSTAKTPPTSPQQVLITEPEPNFPEECVVQVVNQVEEEVDPMEGEDGFKTAKLFVVNSS